MPQLSLGALLTTMTLFALSFGLIKTAYQCQGWTRLIWMFAGILLLGSSLGFPCGYMLYGRRGALVGAVLGALALFLGLWTAIVVFGP